jgi:hypothetical protein
MSRPANRRRPNLLGPGTAAVLVAVLFLAFTASSGLAAGGHPHLGASIQHKAKQHKKPGAKTTVKAAKGKNAGEEVIIIGHTKGGKREEVVISGPKGGIGHVSATRGPEGGIGHVTVFGSSSQG